MSLPRRGVLIGLAGVVTGCTGPASEGVRSATTDVPRATASATRRPPEPHENDVGTGGHRRVTIDAVPTSLPAIAREVSRPLSAFRGAVASVLETALSEGSVTTTTTVDAGFDSDLLFVRRDGRYYRVERSILTERSRTGQQFRLRSLTCEGRVAADDEITRAKEDAVAFPDLPPVDRQAVPGFVLESLEDGECVQAGWTHPYPGPDARASSRLLATETTYVLFGDRYYRLDYLGENTVTEHEYRYTTTSVADSLDEFQTVVDEEIVAHPDSTALSQAEVETLRTVLERGQVSWEQPVPPAVDGLVTQLADERYIEWDGEYFAWDVRELVS